MKEIQLTKGKVAIVDDDDFEWLNQWKWNFHKGYAGRSAYIDDGKRRVLFMHREIIKTPIGLITDHKDRNKLNNQKSNLRLCGKSQNRVNSNKNPLSTSKFKGVSIQKMRKNRYTYYLSQVKFNGRTVFFKLFPFTSEGELQAAKAYNDASVKYYGEFADVNSI